MAQNTFTAGMPKQAGVAPAGCRARVGVVRSMCNVQAQKNDRVPTDRLFVVITAGRLPTPTAIVSWVASPSASDHIPANHQPISEFSSSNSTYRALYFRGQAPESHALHGTTSVDSISTDPQGACHRTLNALAFHRAFTSFNAKPFTRRRIIHSTPNLSFGAELFTQRRIIHFAPEPYAYCMGDWCVFQQEPPREHEHTATCLTSDHRNCRTHRTPAATRRHGAAKIANRLVRRPARTLRQSRASDLPDADGHRYRGERSHAARREPNAA